MWNAHDPYENRRHAKEILRSQQQNYGINGQPDLRDMDQSGRLSADGKVTMVKLMFMEFV
ncbi:hypothetical protein EB73_07705 [Mycobacterium sp. SWH-M3]|nr:hypothetical protein EB73_07705 [Mycobacterium sp. SWH-M3]